MRGRTLMATSVENPARTERPENVWAMGWVSFFTDLATEMVYPLLPLFLTSTLGASTAFVGLVEGAAESLSSILKYFSGWIADRSPRLKPLILVGYSLSSLTKPLIALAAVPWHVLAVRLSDRTGKGIRTAPRDSLLSSSVTADRRGWAFGVQRTLDHAGAVVGPLIAAGFLAVYGRDHERMLFGLTAIPALASVLLIALFVKDVPRAEPIQKAPLRFTLAPFDTNFRAYLGVMLLFTLGNASDAFLLLRARDFGVTIALIPMIWVALHLVKMASSIPAGLLSDRIGRKSLILGGWTVYALVYAGFAYGSTPWHAWALFLVYGLYFGLTEGVEKAFIADLTPASLRGTAYGAFHFILGLAALPASLLMGILWKAYGAPVAFIVSAALAFAAMLMLGAVVRERKAPATS